MFGSMCLFPEFYMNRLKLFVAIAPVVWLTNMKSPICTDMAKDEKSIAGARAIGPELLTAAASSNVFKGFVTSSKLGSFISGAGMSKVTDAKPENMGEEGYNRLC